MGPKTIRNNLSRYLGNFAHRLRTFSWLKDSEASSSNRHGLFDLFILTSLGYCLYAITPFGSISEKCVRAALGHKNLPSIFETFRAHETQVAIESPDKTMDTGLLMKTTPLPFVELLNNLPRKMLLAIIQAHGECKKAVCSIEAPPYWRETLPDERLKQLSAFEEAGQIPLSTYAEALAQAVATFNGRLETAIEALYVGSAPVRQAIKRAKRTKHRHAFDVVVHAPYFSPGLKRGPLKDAYTILSRYRLLTLAWPMDEKYKINSPYGMRIHPILNREHFHDGVDMAALLGTRVRSAHRGVVRRVAFDSVGGNYVIVDHGFGIRTHYYHLSKALVKKGQVVRKGQLIGLVGATGRVTGTHLHYSLWIGGRTVNPAHFGYVEK